MTIQQQLANRLYELLPHKKELQLGTAWEDEQAKWVYVAGFSITTSQIGGWTSMKPEESQIIGQPLRLADLLMALGKNGNKVLWNRNAFGRTNIEEIYMRYHLPKDNVLDQSDEFCEFVLELLK